jgi:hypothetical protein
VRDGINIARYALKRLSREKSKNSRPLPKERVAAGLKEAATMILDKEAADYFAALIQLDADDRHI